MAAITPIKNSQAMMKSNLPIVRYFNILKTISVRLAALVVAGSILSACTATPSISDIDKSHPSVTLTVRYDALVGKVDWSAGKRKATTQCIKLGYATAKPLEGIRKSCVVNVSLGCDTFQAERKYICENKIQ